MRKSSKGFALDPVAWNAEYVELSNRRDAPLSLRKPELMEQIWLKRKFHALAAMSFGNADLKQGGGSVLQQRLLFWLNAGIQ